MKIISLISATLLLFVAWTNPVNTTAEDPVAVLKKAQNTFEGLKDFSANFTFTLSNPTDPDATITKKGSLMYSKGKYAVKMSDQEIYCNGEKIWVYIPDPDEPEVTIYPNDPEEGFDIESMLQLYKANAKARHDGRETVAGANCHNIYLANSDREQEFNQARVWINSKTNLPMKVETVTRSQTRTLYTFNGIKTNQGLGASNFEFNTSAHPDVEVYDETE